MERSDGAIVEVAKVRESVPRHESVEDESVGRELRDERARARPRTIAWAALVAAVARVLGAALVLALGFRVVSDDDFARVVIAQRFAAAPRLDPSGTSWLPLPFWMLGSVMKVFGPTLEVARATVVLGAAIGGALVTGVAIAAGMRPRRAIAAAIVAAAMPWGMQLAVATVPEVPAAAYAAAGVIALAAASSRVRLIGALALLASTLSRYDAWPLAIGFAVFTAVDAARATRRDRARLVLAVLLALAGPVLWSAWQYAVFGDAFRYLRLVRSYRQALGHGPSLAQRVIGYPLGVVEEMREVVGAGLVGGIAAWVVAHRAGRIRRNSPSVSGAAREVTIEPSLPILPTLPSLPSLRWQRPLLLVLGQLVLLVYGDVRDGAPTHHPERALLGAATIVLFASADAVGAFLAGERSPGVRRTVVSVAIVALAGWIGVRLHRSLPWFAAGQRIREVAAGRTLAREAPPGTRVLVDSRDLPNGSLDYGYYALLAAFGRPIDAEVDRDQDPRRPRTTSSFADTRALDARLAATGARAMLAWGDPHRETMEAIGAQVVASEGEGAPPRWSIGVLPVTRVGIDRAGHQR